tara:strand:- start:110 stop:529 length:420 start_codon:yes stop_codon:yes gene_type:complete
MRVKLQYSVELDEVPEIVADLIEEESLHLNDSGRMIQEVCSALRQAEPSIDFILKKIDKARQMLGALDSRLNEMEGLLSGYEAAVNPPPPQPVPQPVRRAITPNNSPPQPPMPVPASDKINPETGAYNYERPYAKPEDI